MQRQDDREVLVGHRTFTQRAAHQPSRVALRPLRHEIEQGTGGADARQTVDLAHFHGRQPRRPVDDKAGMPLDAAVPAPGDGLVVHAPVVEVQEPREARVAEERPRLGEHRRPAPLTLGQRRVSGDPHAVVNLAQAADRVPRLRLAPPCVAQLPHREHTVLPSP
ncbi:hypothetical protein LRS13_19570 [Svornostia abyssi]|uniref:Uncharacterized protein n=1 Tax=Svornostia abyssi TaxID=2898438 RepID=A0ABY5PDV1_9ACTN|nr:hypothetical protein LRS13_19570 [Parviterribacteraceae bacterium J379]